MEAFCFGCTDDNGNYPCGRNCPSHLCLENGHCPHFAYSKTTERMVAHFPPIRLIVKDRLRIWFSSLYWKIRWIFWDSLWFNRRKTMNYFKNIPVATAKDTPELAKYEAEQEEDKVKFTNWFEKVKKDPDASWFLGDES